MALMEGGIISGLPAFLFKPKGWGKGKGKGKGRTMGSLSWPWAFTVGWETSTVFNTH